MICIRCGPDHKATDGERPALRSPNVDGMPSLPQNGVALSFRPFVFLGCLTILHTEHPPPNSTHKNKSAKQSIHPSINQSSHRPIHPRTLQYTTANKPKKMSSPSTAESARPRGKKPKRPMVSWSFDLDSGNAVDPFAFGLGWTSFAPPVLNIRSSSSLATELARDCARNARRRS